MSKKLNILRHAKTERTSLDFTDHSRKLMNRGIKQANEMANWIKKNAISTEIIFVSDAKRTLQTAEILKKNKAISDYTQTHQLYLTESTELLSFLAKQKEDEVFIIGHNDGISDLVSYLIDDYVSIQTCGFIQLELLVDDWQALSRGVAQVKLQFRPNVPA